MASSFCISVHFLDPVPAYHGRRDAAEPEWPPSPLRLFQALVAAASRLEPVGIGTVTRASLEWLEGLGEPLIVAPRESLSTGRRLSVPNNTLDVVARAWSRGNESESGDADPRTHRSMKTVQPVWMLEPSPIRYLWPVPEAEPEIEQYTARLSRLARSLVALGWGVDLVAGDGAVVSDEEIQRYRGERWQPGERGVARGLRVASLGTLGDLCRRHEQFLMRLGPTGFTPPQPIMRYGTIEYRPATSPNARRFAAFALRRVAGEGFRAFDVLRRGLTVSGMLRYATKNAAQSSGWSAEQVNRFVLGHGEGQDEAHVPVGTARFAYLPLPSIEHRGDGRIVVGPIRRVLVTAFGDNCDSELVWAAKALPAQDLVNENTGEVLATLEPLPSTDKLTTRYTTRASTWSSVTPIVLPGYDDPNHLRRKLSRPGITAEKQHKYLEQLNVRIDRLLRRSLVHAGLSKPIADCAQIEWRKTGFLPGVGFAESYGVPDHLKRFPRYHVRVEFRDPSGAPLDVHGPLCIGGGRHYGIGLLAACSI